MERDPSRRRFITGCCVAGAGALAAGGLAGGAAAEGAVGQLDPPATRWDRTYEQGTSADANAVAPASDGGFVAVGTTEPSDGETASEVWLYKVDAAGRQVWERTFSERAVTEGFDIVATDGGFVVAGHTREEGADAQSGFALRVDGEGAEQWRRVFDARPETTDTMRAVDADAEGRFVFAGWTSRFDDAWVARLDDTGGIDWAETYGPGTANRYHGAVAGPDGGYVVVGETDDNAGDTAGWAVKLDDEGTQEFSQQFKKQSDSATNPDDDYNVFYDVSGTRNGFVAVGANAFDPQTNDQRGWALEFNVDGGKLWDKRYTESNYTELRGVTAGNLEYFVVGETATDGEGTDARGYAANLGIEGQLKWSGTWGTGSSEFSAFHLTDAEGLVSVGSTAASAGASTSGWGVKIGGEEVATATPSLTPSPARSPTPSPSPTFSPTPTDGADETDAAGGDGDGTDTAAPTPTDAPADGSGTTAPGGGGDTETTAAGSDGGISPTTIGIGVVILALGGGGLLYNRFLAGGGDEDVAGPGEGTGGAAPLDTDDGDGGDGPGAAGDADAGGESEAADAGDADEPDGSAGDAGDTDVTGDGTASTEEAGGAKSGSDEDGATGGATGEATEPASGDDRATESGTGADEQTGADGEDGGAASSPTDR